MNPVLRLDHHALTHLIAAARGDAITLEDNRLAEVLMADMKAAGYDVDWAGPDPSHYGLRERRATRLAPDPERLARAIWAAAFARDGETISDRHLDDGDEWYGSPRELALAISRAWAEEGAS